MVSSFVSFAANTNYRVDSVFNNTIDVEPGVGTATRSVFTSGDGLDSATISITETNAATRHFDFRANSNSFRRLLVPS